MCHYHASVTCWSCSQVEIDLDNHRATFWGQNDQRRGIAVRTMCPYYFFCFILLWCQWVLNLALPTFSLSLFLAPIFVAILVMGHPVVRRSTRDRWLDM
jgi:hypothetical protein